MNIPPPSEPADFKSVYERYFSFVWRTAGQMGIDESALDDVCQETFVAIHRRLPEFEGRSSLKTWIFGILRNVMRTHRRSLNRKSPEHRSKSPTVDPETLAARGQTPEDEASTAQDAELARQILSGLDEEKRAVLVLVELEQLPVPEVAEALGSNLNTTYTRLRAARKEFTAALKRHRSKERWGME